MNAIEIKGLTKKYKDTLAVDGLDLVIPQGELFSLLGINGAGKTTTIKMLSCLLKPDGGQAHLLGHSIIEDPSGVKAVIGISPQETAVAPNLTVRFVFSVNKPPAAKPVQVIWASVANMRIPHSSRTS